MTKKSECDGKSPLRWARSAATKLFRDYNSYSETRKSASETKPPGPWSLLKFAYRLQDLLGCSLTEQKQLAVVSIRLRTGENLLIQIHAKAGFQRFAGQQFVSARAVGLAFGA